ncbi:hypothetical protein AMELA_G00147920 [Ameiurus melas]|uniref:Uncharacterized protein n=1 Tax=Ameiurus melas TaxID=219545 RepID=A0A7J6AGS2_AMEME|nr:hypothetical protein AMELA_G00147920 [Ameiurus melas]
MTLLAGIPPFEEEPMDEESLIIQNLFHTQTNICNILSITVFRENRKCNILKPYIANMTPCGSVDLNTEEIFPGHKR